MKLSLSVLLHAAPSRPATPLKILTPDSFSMTQGLHSLTPKRSSATAECVEIPPRLSNWKLHNVGSKVALCRLLDIPNESPPVSLSHVLSFANGKRELWIHGKAVAPATLSFPTTCTSRTVEQLLSSIESFRVCEGIVDPSLLAVVDPQVAILDGVPTLGRNGAVHLQVARDLDCEMLLVPGQMFRCQKCTE